jgi:hypothetical protein
MKRLIGFLFLLNVCATNTCFGQTSEKIKQFVFFSREREGIHDSIFYNNPGVDGAQITYPWKRLEPQKDEYDFSEIEEDLQFLKSKGKKLFIQIQDVTFDTTLMAVPKYVMKDPIYHGGQDPQYSFTDDNRESDPVRAGWVSRRWDPAVAERFHKLLHELAKKYDGRIEGINLPESSIEEGTSGKYFPQGFNFAAYRDAIKGNMLVLTQAFQHSAIIQYANFFPGPTTYLQELFDYAKQIKVGMGGPDIKVYRKFQMENSYPMIRAMYGYATTGVAVQEGNYSVINDKTGKPVTVPEILDFARDYLRLNYIFWCTEEPFYSKQVLPMLRALKTEKH